MKYIIFYGAILVPWIFLYIISYYKRFDIRHIVIGLISIGYSLAYEVLLGIWTGLYYYLDHANSPLYITLAALLIYPVFNMLYTILLPEKKILVYTIFWILGMMLFEYFGVTVGIIVFTGWKPVPWSLVTYLVTYLWVYCFHKYLSGRIPA